MMKREHIVRRARKKARSIAQLRADERFVRTIALLKSVGLLEHNRIRSQRAFVTLQDYLWASELEPRLFELLPAILLKRPKLLARTENLPEDLAEILSDIRRGEPKKSFRDVPVDKYLYWIDKVGHSNKRPSLIKSYRFSQKDLAILEDCKTSLDTSEIDVIRQGLYALRAKLQEQVDAEIISE